MPAELVERELESQPPPAAGEAGEARGPARPALPARLRRFVQSRMIAGVNLMLYGAGPPAAMTCALLTATFVAAATMPQPVSMLAQPGAPAAQKAVAQAPDQAPPAQDEPRPPQEPAKRRDQRVTGKVVDRDGKSIEHAEVSFGGPKKNKVFTDGRGEFSFTGPAGEYTVTVKAGSRRQGFTVKIDDNKLDPSTLIIEPEGLL
jgi:hypothetical protein